MDSNSFFILNSIFIIIYFVCVNYFFDRFFLNGKKYKKKNVNICELFNSLGYYIFFLKGLLLLFI